MNGLTPSVRRVRAQVGDRLLLCSDGLSDYVDEREIAQLLRTSDRHAALSQLVDAALRNGSRDNVTVVIADVLPGQDPQAGWLDALPYPA